MSAIARWRVAYFWAIGLTCGIILENVYFQLIFDPGSIPRGMWVLAERSPMENLLFICYGLAVLRGASVSLQLRARELPEGDDPLLAESIDRLLPLYSRKIFLLSTMVRSGNTSARSFSW